MLRSLEEMTLQRLAQWVIPAKAGIHEPPKNLDSRFRRSDRTVLERHLKPALGPDRGTG